MRVYTLVFLLFLGLNIFAQTEYDVFEQANSDFKNKNYEKALKKYLSIEKKDKYSSKLYYNIGNTYFRMEDYPNAMLYYERGLRLNPKNNELGINKKVCRSRLKGDVFDIKDVFFVTFWKYIYNSFMPSTWTIITILLILISSISFISYYFSVNHKVSLFYIFLVSIVIFIVSVFAGISRQNSIKSKKEAIIFCEPCQGKESPDEKSSDNLSMYGGQKVEIVLQEDDWVKVRQEDGKEAWILTKCLVVI